MSLAWGVAGWTAGTVVKSAVGAFALILLWTTILQVRLNYYAPEMPKAGVLSTTYCPTLPPAPSHFCSDGSTTAASSEASARSRRC